MAMWLAKKYFADKKQSQHQQQQNYGPPPGQQGELVRFLSPLSTSFADPAFIPVDFLF